MIFFSRNLWFVRNAIKDIFSFHYLSRNCVLETILRNFCTLCVMIITSNLVIFHAWTWTLRNAKFLPEGVASQDSWIIVYKLLSLNHVRLGDKGVTATGFEVLSSWLLLQSGCKEEVPYLWLQSGPNTAVNRLADRHTGSYISLIRDLKGFFSEEGTRTKGPQCYP